MKISKEYIAGFLDGEGYIGLIRHNNVKKYKRGFIYQPIVRITQRQKDARLFDILKENYGGYIYNRKQYNNNQATSDWALTGRKLIKKFLLDIQPYSLVKKEQIKELIRFILIPKNKDNKEFIFQKQYMSYKRLSILNKKGI